MFVVERSCQACANCLLANSIKLYAQQKDVSSIGSFETCLESHTFRANLWVDDRLLVDGSALVWDKLIVFLFVDSVSCTFIKQSPRSFFACCSCRAATHWCKHSDTLFWCQWAVVLALMSRNTLAIVFRPDEWSSLTAHCRPHLCQCSPTAATVLAILRSGVVGKNSSVHLPAVHLSFEA